jgi:hypothetical protein
MKTDTLPLLGTLCLHMTIIDLKVKILKMTKRTQFPVTHCATKEKNPKSGRPLVSQSLVGKYEKI